MKLSRIIAIISMGSTTLVSSRVNADYLNLSDHFEHNDGAGHDIYRVYANFTSPDDYFILGGGTSSTGDPSQHMVIHSTADPFGLTFGHSFFNPGGSGSVLAPDDPSELNGTFVTVGVPESSLGSSPFEPHDETFATPGFVNFINGNYFNSANVPQGAGFTIGVAKPQGQASYIDAGNDTNTRVLIMQLAVVQGDGVAGTLNVITSTSHGLELFPSQTFLAIPAPHTGFLFVLMGTIGCRRRRSQ